jgi:hypothetical protein
MAATITGPNFSTQLRMVSPASDGLIGYVEPALGEEILDVSMAECET